MHPLSFLIFLPFTAIFLWSMSQMGTMLIVPYVVAFVLIPIIDAVVGVSKTNPNETQESFWKTETVWAPFVYIYALSHFILLFYGVYQSMTASWPQLVVLAGVVGMYTGGLGITVAHELCHKKEALPRWTADLLLSSVWYQHFSVEHVRGHHLHVSTPQDPASARRNEALYVFLIRSLHGSFFHALEIEKKRLGRTWHPDNKVLHGILMSLVFTGFAAILGTKVLVFFILQAVIAFLFLEMVNYIEHYGLSRRPLGNGRYEKVTPIHSWNSAHWFSNALLFNLQRHSDHHAWAHLPYTVLRHHDEAPQLPSGYPAMVLLALVPPVWFRFMNPRVDEWQAKQSQNSTSA